VNSTTAGCIPAGIPFALACQDPVEIRETVARVSSVTHTNSAAIAGAPKPKIKIAITRRFLQKWEIGRDCFVVPTVWDSSQ
jgi:ADP-ribosylglycohydrolase